MKATVRWSKDGLKLELRNGDTVLRNEFARPYDLSTIRELPKGADFANADGSACQVEWDKPETVERGVLIENNTIHNTHRQGVSDFYVDKSNLEDVREVLIDIVTAYRGRIEKTEVDSEIFEPICRSAMGFSLRVLTLDAEAEHNDLVKADLRCRIKLQEEKLSPLVEVQCDE